MKLIKFMSLINRKDETFLDFLKKYWWIEFLVIIKIIYFVNQDYYQINFALIFLIGSFVILWVLYRLGME